MRDGTAAHAFHPTLLREYDIRGIVGSTLHEADALAIGRAFGTMVAGRGGRRVCLGYDGRLSSPALAVAAGAGLQEAGLEVLTIGLGPTPMMYFAVNLLGADGGIQVTGSHNPPDYNGFKLMLGTAPFYGEQIKELGLIA
ncbi:MAG TPA: phosphomannomutase, partial [Geminicoccaceae bacterium]|nr:phosphomannomutase [Geminicoccaceae bacterium]